MIYVYLGGDVERHPGPRRADKAEKRAEAAEACIAELEAKLSGLQEQLDAMPTAREQRSLLGKVESRDTLLIDIGLDPGYTSVPVRAYDYAKNSGSQEGFKHWAGRSVRRG